MMLSGSPPRAKKRIPCGAESLQRQATLAESKLTGISKNQKCLLEIFRSPESRKPPCSPGCFFALRKAILQRKQPRVQAHL